MHYVSAMLEGRSVYFVVCRSYKSVPNFLPMHAAFVKRQMIVSLVTGQMIQIRRRFGAHEQAVLSLLVGAVYGGFSRTSTKLAQHLMRQCGFLGSKVMRIEMYFLIRSLLLFRATKLFNYSLLGLSYMDKA